MLYYLFEWLHKLNFPGAGMFGYTSFRALMAVILALLISVYGETNSSICLKRSKSRKHSVTPRPTRSVSTK